MKNYKICNNGPIIKNYTIFGKKKVWGTQIHHQILAVIDLKGIKRPQKGANLENTPKLPLNDLKVPLRGQNDLLWSNGWFYWIQEVKTYKKWAFNLQYSNFSFFCPFKLKYAFKLFKLAKMHISLEFMSCYLMISLMGHNKLLKKTYLVKLGGGAGTPPASHRAISYFCLINKNEKIRFYN